MFESGVGLRSVQTPIEAKELLKQPIYSKHALFVEQTSHSGGHYGPQYFHFVIINSELL